MSVLQHGTLSSCSPRKFGPKLNHVNRDLFECPEYVLWYLRFAALSCCSPCKFGPGLNRDLFECPQKVFSILYKYTSKVRLLKAGLSLARVSAFLII